MYQNKEQLKILVISHLYPSSFNEVGGIFVHEQIKALKSCGCKIKVISPVPWPPFPINHLSEKWKKYSEISKKANWNGVEVYYPRYLVFPKKLFFSSSGRRMYIGIRKLIKKIYSNFKFDIIHSHVALPDGFAGMLIANRYEKPLALTIHGADLQQTIHRNKSCKSKIKQAIRYSNYTIVNSKKLKQISERTLEVPSKKTKIIPNGVNLSKIVEESKVNSQIEYQNNKVILSVSNLKNTKGIDLNLKSIATLKEKYPNILYLIVGKGAQKNRLKKLSKKLEIERNVKFLGQLLHEKVMQYMNICDIFSLPSWNEAFGVVYIEAMAHGKPVIACRNEGIDGIVKHEKTGMLVKPKDIDSITNAIDFLLSNPQNAKKIGDNAKRLIRNNYTWQQNAEKTIKVYKKILKNEEKE